MTDPTRRQIMQMADEVGITDYPAAVWLVQRAFEVSRSARAAIEADGPIDDLIPSKYRGWEITVYRDGAQAGYRAAIARYGPKPEGREPASVVGESIDVEQVAQQVFEAMRFSGATSPAPPEWVPGGNSLMQDHARDVARAILTRWGHQPAPPAAGEVGELSVVHATAPERIWLYLNGANEYLPFRNEDDVVWSPDPIDSSDIPYVRADLLEQRHLAPALIAERSWEREGWCDDQGRCWCFFDNSSERGWQYRRPQPSFYDTHCLPHYALPLPAGEVGQ